MPARVSATGVTQYQHGTGPVFETSQNSEASELIDVSKGVHVPAPDYAWPAQKGSKAKGATRTKGGAI